jgi:cytochrome c2
MKKLSIKRISSNILLLFLGITIITVIYSCKASQKVAAKSGAQLWAENCQRCHNTPSPSTFSPEQWETVGMHMQTRALITDDERKKIVDFLKQ